MNQNKFQAKFNHTLKIFAGKMEASKQKQEQILETFESNLNQDNENLAKVTEQIKSKEVTIAIMQNALSNTDQQLQFRDEALELTQEEIKNAEATIKSLVKTHREYVQQIHQEFDQ
jgi:hypothetical protein